MEEETIIRSSFSSEASLYLAYMPFISNGGLFIRTMQEYPLGEKVKLYVTLMDEPDEFQVDAKVIWWTPKGAQGNKPAGIGLQFEGEAAQYLCNKIETYLAALLKSTKMSDTI